MTDGAGDPLWYKDALIYQVHVRTFCDSNGDGIGDFPGLTSRLDYIARLGVSAIWLLPFYPSPLKDDGYDIAHYEGVHPSLRHAARFPDVPARGARARAAGDHRAGDQSHLGPARVVRGRAAGAARLAQARLLRVERHARPLQRRAHHLQDTEHSNWAWDHEAKAYYWHRFFSHQPDLNFDNPRVVRAVHQGDELLAGHGRRRPAPRRRALPDRARRHDLREPAGNARHPQAPARGAGRALREPHAPGRSESVAGGRAAVFRRRRRKPHGVPLPADAAPVHRRQAGRSPSDHRRAAPDARPSRDAASGRRSCATTTS